MDRAAAKEVMDRAAELLRAQFKVDTDALPEAQRPPLYAVAPELIAALTEAFIILVANDLHHSIPADQPVTAFCHAGMKAVGDRRHGNEILMSAFATFEAVAGVITALTTPPADDDLPGQARAIRAGFWLGRADVRRIHVVTGIWRAFERADANQQLLTREAERRQQGGRMRAAAVKREAELWKQHLLPLAVDLDRKHPKWTRQQLAMELLHSHQLDKELGLKTVENWLKDEAEEPNGPIPSRARKKRA